MPERRELGSGLLRGRGGSGLVLKGGKGTQNAF